jgi:hypothetical protein
MKDRQALLAEARDKRDLAAFVRRVAAVMSLKADRETLLVQAAVSRRRPTRSNVTGMVDPGGGPAVRGTC